MSKIDFPAEIGPNITIFGSIENGPFSKRELKILKISFSSGYTVKMDHFEPERRVSDAFKMCLSCA